MQMSVEYLGLDLKNPLISAASPVSFDTDKCKILQDKGIAAIVMHSLFEEAINSELHEVDHMLFHGRDSFAEALEFFPDNEFTNFEADNYLNQIRDLKEALDIPVIASLNGVSVGGWVKYARLIEEAGADALELNIYYPADRTDESCTQIEKAYISTVEAVVNATNLKFAVKLSPYFTSLPHLLKSIESAGAKGAVLFNRFYLPDIDLENLEWTNRLYHGTEADFAKALRAIAINYGQSDLQLCINGGVKNGKDIIKAVMAGATTIGIASVLYDRGLEEVSQMLNEAKEWMEEMEYESFNQMRGSISYAKAPNPSALERANYIDIIKHNDIFWQD